jgi:hypothetical protein
MTGMLQILTYLLSFYLVIKGVEILQIALASGRSSRKGVIIVGALALAACLVAAIGFSYMQDRQAMSLQDKPPTAEAQLPSSDDSRIPYVLRHCVGTQCEDSSVTSVSEEACDTARKLARQYDASGRYECVKQ